VSAFARVNKSMYTQDGFVLPRLMYKRENSTEIVFCIGGLQGHTCVFVKACTVVTFMWQHG
jgi:hypothetical protein